MRIALLTALPAHPDRGGIRPAFRNFAGKNVLTHQVDCAILLGCDSIVCLSTGTGKDIVSARQHATRSGLRFELVDKPLALASLISASDELVVLADGILPDRTALIEHLGGKQGVLSFPSDKAVPMGFERIDPTKAWSGALRTSGAVVNPLLDLPADCDVASSLLRISLQRSTPIIEAEEALLSESSWLRRVTPQAASATEWNWITRQVQPAPFVAPALALCDRMGLRLAQDGVNGRWAKAPLFGCLAGLSGALIALVLGSPVTGLLFLLLASMLLALAEVFHKVAHLGAARSTKHLLLPWAGFARDIMMVLLSAAVVVVDPTWIQLFLALLLLGVLFLGEKTAVPSIRALFRDRPAAIGLLAAAAIFDVALIAEVAIISAGFASLLIPHLRLGPRITAH